MIASTVVQVNTNDLTVKREEHHLMFVLRLRKSFVPKIKHDFHSITEGCAVHDRFIF